MGAQNALNRTIRGVITNIQRFSLHDGPGVRSTVFFKGCPLRCLWCHNPETLSFGFCLSHDAAHCLACRSCAAACESGALTVTQEGLHFHAARCSHCFACAGECPTGALSVLGRSGTAYDVLNELLPDKGMYSQTGGGVTLSGGEPSAQPMFAQVLIQALHTHGIQTALDTCGYAQSETFLSLCRDADLVLFDIKHVNNAAHKRLTGREFTLIERNFLLLKEELTPIQVRIPVIPGLNDDDRTHRAMAALIRKNPRVESVLLLGYHPLGSAKGIGLAETRSAFTAALPLKARLMEMAQAMSERTGIPCTFR